MPTEPELAVIVPGQGHAAVLDLPDPLLCVYGSCRMREESKCTGCKGADHETFVKTYPEETEMPWRVVLLPSEFQLFAAKVNLIFALRWSSRLAEGSWH